MVLRGPLVRYRFELVSESFRRDEEDRGDRPGDRATRVSDGPFADAYSVALSYSLRWTAETSTCRVGPRLRRVSFLPPLSLSLFFFIYLFK